MSARTQVTGNLGQDPSLTYTKTGKAFVGLSLGCTAASKDQQTGKWADDGDPLWIRAPFFGDQAETLAATLAKGDRISVEGDLVLRSYQDRDGNPRQSLELRFPRFLGVIPRKNAAGPSGTAASYSQPATDPWGTQPSASGYDQTSEAPF